MKFIKAVMVAFSLLWAADASAQAPSKPAPENWKSKIWYLHDNRPANIIGPLPHIKHGPLAFPATWAGYVDILDPPRPGPELEATLVVPQFNAHDANLDAVSYWTGFDGVVDSDHLLHSGIDCYINGSTLENGCYTWVAYFPDVTIGLFSVSIGDALGLFSWHNTDGNGGGFCVYNYTNGDASCGNITCNAPTCLSRDPYTGTSAEWIVEAPEINGKRVPMVNIVGGVEIYNDVMLSFDGGRDRYPGDQPETSSYELTLVQNGVVVAAPQKTSPFSFNVVTYP